MAVSINTNHMFCQIYVTGLFYIENLGQFHTLLQPKVVFQELNYILEIQKIPYLNANSISKKILC